MEEKEKVNKGGAIAWKPGGKEAFWSAYANQMERLNNGITEYKDSEGVWYHFCFSAYKGDGPFAVLYSDTKKSWCIDDYELKYRCRKINYCPYCGCNLSKLAPHGNGNGNY